MKLIISSKDETGLSQIQLIFETDPYVHLDLNLWKDKDERNELPWEIRLDAGNQNSFVVRMSSKELKELKTVINEITKEL